jgi:hypothetical protein
MKGEARSLGSSTIMSEGVLTSYRIALRLSRFLLSFSALRSDESTLAPSWSVVLRLVVLAMSVSFCVDCAGACWVCVALWTFWTNDAGESALLVSLIICEKDASIVA